MKPPAFIAAALLAGLAGPALGQSQLGAGQGGAVGSLGELRQALGRQWAGRPGQLVKGAVGLGGFAAAARLGTIAAIGVIGDDGMALLSGGVQADGSPAPNPGTTTSTTTSTGTSTSTSTGTN